MSEIENKNIGEKTLQERYDLLLEEYSQLANKCNDLSDKYSQLIFEHTSAVKTFHASVTSMCVASSKDAEIKSRRLSPIPPPPPAFLGDRY